jgi:type I restriction-modification system DNA methylase subunit/restriction endonuclease S subunit
MLNQKNYSCGICKTTPDQISHHKSHVETQKHKDKREVFEFRLYKLTREELEEKYKTINIEDIIKETETIIYTNKKLIQDVITIEEANEMSTFNISMSEQTNSVSNKEALKDKIHEIHNYLRNNGAGYGMNALKVFNILYGLKKIEENGLLDKVSLKRPDCEFSYLLKIANENKEEKLTELIFGPVMKSIKQSELYDLLFYVIPENIKSSVFSHLIKEINKITLIEQTCNVLLSGKIYEYFIGRDESAISELGAYFTDRHITKYAVEKVGPIIKEDGTIASMIDMFGGSGGFTTEYINYLNEMYPQLINWATEINKISHFDMNEDVIKSAGLEFFCLTGVLPNKNNLKYKNSFTDDFGGKKYDLVFTNPPYGGDKSSKTETQSKREKVKEYIKNELLTTTDEGLRIRRQQQLKKIEAREKQDKIEQDKTKVSVSSCSARIQKFANDHNKLKGNDKESCSLMLMMDILEVGGTAVGVLKEGVFFNKTYKDLRNCLIENFNVREVISVPQDQFENTSTKTSIVIFDNSEQKTSQVLFSDLVVERYEEDVFEELGGDIMIVENKGDIKGVRDVPVSQATREELLSNPICSLNGKDYGKKEIICGQGFELVKLGDICEFMQKSKRNASFGQSTGKHNFYTSSDKVQKCDVVDYTEECLIIGDGGVANIKMDINFSCSDHNHIIKTNNNTYIYYLLSGKIELLSDGFSGSVLKNLSKEYLKNLQIPVPKSPAKIQEWVDKISSPYNEKNTKQTQIKELELFVQNRIKEIGDKEECDEVELGSVCNFVNGKKRNTTEGKLNGLYPLFSSSLIVDNWIDNYDYDKECLIINTINGSGKFNLQHSNKFCTTSNTIVFNTENINLTLYIYYFGLINIDVISNLSNGSTKKKMGKSEISKFILKIPKDKQLIQDLEATFQQIETLQNEVKIADELYKQYIQELIQEAIPVLSEPVVSKPVVSKPVEKVEKNKKTRVSKTKTI